MPEKETLESLNLFSDLPEAKDLLIYGADSEYRLLCAIHYYKQGRQVVFVAKGEYEAKKAFESLQRHLPGDAYVCLYPREQLYFTQMDSFSRESANLRQQAARIARSGQACLMVASIWALCEKRPFSASAKSISFTVGDEINLEEAISFLVESGYEREFKAEAQGQIALRGSIIDVFAGSEASPARIELFGDEVESIRLYDPETQLSIEQVSSYAAFPFADAVLSPTARAKALEGLSAEAEEQISKMPDDKQAEARESFAEYYEMLSASPEQADRIAFMYSGINAISIAELFSDALFALNEPAALMEGYKAMQTSVGTDYSMLSEDARAFPTQLGAFYSYQEAQIIFSRHACVQFSMMKLDSGSLSYDAAAVSLTGYKNNAASFFALLPKYLESGYAVCALYESPDGEGPLRTLFASYGYSISALGAGKISLYEGYLGSCLDLAGKKILLVPLSAIFAKTARPQPKRLSKKATDAFFSDIAPGDYIVHDLYGIGRYDGIHRLTLDGASRDYIRITYAKEDVLYIKTEQMHLVEKYIGSGDAPPKLNRLGTGEWSAAKSKARGTVKELAKEYIKMYAQRAMMPGYRYSPDTEWQKDFEAKFAFEPTDDQLRCTEEIKEDMEKPIPMDRLLLGDVGYGKTEVALRAAFKAVMEGKQVAVLVPTTILALQHYNTFVERFSGFPIKIEMVSRLRTPKQRRKAFSDANAGVIDILIGTHAILSESVAFRDLGLLVVDEEQRFGVAHKDKLKLLKQNVDTLTLTATPIPRTLHMSLIGIKDISTIETPPQNRLPVLTYVMAYDEITVKEAILNELSRDGQIFYLHNRIQTIDECALRIMAMAPDAKVTVAHAKMKPSDLENAVLSFLKQETDILVSTSIIENGVDFINANTIIIENSDLLGLSQLYQLRGRVGRGDRQAYAYMTYKKEKTLSEDAYKRLESIREFTKFGSGFKVAMRDLEIRGAGSMLGARQHGHFANVGFELYTRMLAEEVADLSLDAITEREEQASCEIDIKVEAYLPNEYIEGEESRIEAYKRIASIKNEADREYIASELLDRYGNMPPSVSSLLDIALARENATQAKVKKIIQVGSSLSLYIPEDAQAAADLLMACADFSPILRTPPRSEPFISIQLGEDALSALKSIFI
ncbi:MAG: transcription-repair coupling factor [Eubacteriaceae bacterium]|nr:transcription-repair coupling factor [Eubacteriaceae bacterium]